MCKRKGRLLKSTTQYIRYLLFDLVDVTCSRGRSRGLACAINYNNVRRHLAVPLLRDRVDEFDYQQTIERYCGKDTTSMSGPKSKTNLLMLKLRR